VPLLRQRQQALGEKVQARGPDRQLVGLGAEQTALGADPVAEVEQFEQLEIERRQRVLPHIDLNRLAAIRQDQEIGLAERPDPENAAARDRVGPLRLEIVVRPGAVRLDEGPDRMRAFEPLRVDPDAELRNLGEVRFALRVLFFLGGHLVGFERSGAARFTALSSSGFHPTCR
jgi:hypothetical protein